MDYDQPSFKLFCETNKLTSEQGTAIVLEKIGELKRQLEGGSGVSI